MSIPVWYLLTGEYPPDGGGIADYTALLARALADAGVGVGDVVAITGHRSAALVRALVGTMKSGAAFLVLDPAYPAARLGDYVRIAHPAAHLHLSAASALPDEVLALLADTIRTTDKVARFGGEEFVVLLREIELADAEALAARLGIPVVELHSDALETEGRAATYVGMLHSNAEAIAGALG